MDVYKHVLNALAQQKGDSLLCPKKPNKTKVIMRNEDKLEYEDPYRFQNNLRSHRVRSRGSLAAHL